MGAVGHVAWRSFGIGIVFLLLGRPRWSAQNEAWHEEPGARAVRTGEDGWTVGVNRKRGPRKIIKQESMIIYEHIRSKYGGL